MPLLLKVKDDAKSHVIDAGTDARYGARPLRRAVETLIADPVAEFIASAEVEGGDVVEIECAEGELCFYRSPRSEKRIVA